LALECGFSGSRLHAILQTTTLPAVVHLRIVAPPDLADEVLQRLLGTRAVVGVVHLPGVARHPDGDLILCDVASEEASVVVSDLRALGVHKRGSIAVERLTAAVSDYAEEAEEAAAGAPYDAVLWEEVLSTTTEASRLSGAFLVFMMLACILAGAGIILDSAITIVGAMVVGPEFGPLAAFCIAVVQRRGGLLRRSVRSLVVGFAIGIAVTYALMVLLRALDVIPETLDPSSHGFSRDISNPGMLAFIIAFSAGIAGMLSVTTSKSGQLVGVLISVTTIPAAANIAVAAAYGEIPVAAGSARQLGVNLGALALSGVLTLMVQRWRYARRRARHRERLARGRRA
jgi:uncharacterized hydrophobic protein (TIGR00271 family)